MNVNIGDLVTDIYPIRNEGKWDYTHGDTGIVVGLGGKDQCPFTAHVFWSCGTLSEISKDDLTVISSQEY